VASLMSPHLRPSPPGRRAVLPVPTPPAARTGRSASDRSATGAVSPPPTSHGVASTGRNPDMMLHDKVAVVYGAGGAIGGAVARAFAAAGATVHVTGRHRAGLEVVAKEITAAGGTAAVAEVDALDEDAIAAHLQAVVDADGRVDISFNAVAISDPGIIG